MRRIVGDPKILGGKPVIEGTRISVEQVLGLLADGLSIAEICEEFPHLVPEDVRAAITWAQASLRNEVILDLDA